jgi:hypothetical protein
LKDINFKKVLQVGFSGGRELEYLSKKYPDVVFEGIDISRDAVLNANKNYNLLNVSFKEGNIKKIDLNSYNLIIFSGFAAYLEKDKLENVIEKCFSSKVNYLFFYEPSKLDGSYRGNMAWNHDYFSILRNSWNVICYENPKAFDRLILAKRKI